MVNKKCVEISLGCVRDGIENKEEIRNITQPHILRSTKFGVSFSVRVSIVRGTKVVVDLDD